jgi:hypothetical protein
MFEVVKETINSYSTFIGDITEMVSKMMGEEYNVRIYKVTKNNSLELDSLVILKSDHNFSPNIYLLPYYEEYLQGAGIKEIAVKICKTYKENSIPRLKENFSYSYENMKPFIIYRLVNYSRNKKLLEKIPHMKYLDLAITFHCLVRDDDDGIGTIRITNEHMKLWDTTLAKLQEQSSENTNRIFQPVIRSMDEVILGILNENTIAENENGGIEITSEIECPNGSQEHKMYILSNRKGINGATCLLYDNILKNFSKQVNSDLYILPSSIHEVILVPFDKTVSRDALGEMVRDINRTQVASDEVLSDQVYIYSRKNNMISL